jgi:glycosyltransferase involved in cell wall biosynthesis
VKILVLNWQDRENPQAGGAELHLHQVFGRIVAAGHSVDLLCSGFDEAPARVRLDGIEVHRIASRFTFNLHAHAYYREQLAKNDYDIVLEDLNKVPLFTPRWGIRTLVVLVHHLFGTTAFREASIPVASAVWLAERPIGLVYRETPFEAVSQSTADDLVVRGIPRESIRVIYNGVDSEHLTPDESERTHEPTFLYLGRLKKYKRVDVIIRAFAELDHPSAFLDIAGTGDFRPELEQLTSSLGLERRVRFHGFVSEDDKLHLLRRAWAVALASPKEGWGISNLEAAACGTPVVATNAPGIRESVVDGETGFLVPLNDPSAMAAAFRGLIASPDLVRTLGGAGRRFAESFTWDRAARDTLQHFHELLAGR